MHASRPDSADGEKKSFPERPKDEMFQQFRETLMGLLLKGGDTTWTPRSQQLWKPSPGPTSGATTAGPASSCCSRPSTANTQVSIASSNSCTDVGDEHFPVAG